MTLEELLKEHEDTILRIKRRLYFFLEFESQLKRISNDKEFRIKNDIVWRLLDDSWRILIIDFSSLAKGMLGSSGFFNQLKTNLNEVKPVKRKEIEQPKGIIHFDGEEPSLEESKQIIGTLNKTFIELILQTNREVLFELFPNARGRNPLKIRHEDIDELKKRFENIVTDVIDDRNKNHAHRYERIQVQFSHNKLNLQHLKDKFEQVEKILNLIRIILSQSSLSYSDMNCANATEAAKDLIMLILWGSNIRIDIHSGLNEHLNTGNDAEERIYGYKWRERLITDSHGYHDRIINGDLKPDALKDLPEKKKFLFNDVDLDVMRRRKL